MGSVASASKIKERTRKFCQSLSNWETFNDSFTIFIKIDTHLQNEYRIIPEKQRIGKGHVYIARYIAKEIYYFLNATIHLSHKNLLLFAQRCLEYKNQTETLTIFYFAIIFVAEHIEKNPEKFKEIIAMIKTLANKEDWRIREGAIYPIISGLKKAPDLALPILSEWCEDEKENIRRLVAESLRPKAEVKWLRDPKKNDEVLVILSKLRKDSSLYVRKAVGNNIKDLTKYMPEKMLQLMEEWLKDSNIIVHDTLATEAGLSTDQKRMISIMKHGMRWMKNKNPKYHQRLEKILGKYYLLYFDEKKNRLAKPK
ncbi:MAG: hypothetical protein BAJALOKI1v1_580013 [Promethearchaeota archaeon]|nr:MAG: hypothetical protein BAJALOKI1v1_580013 [Candidatus Lokiarchaeota archaeon]